MRTLVPTIAPASTGLPSCDGRIAELYQYWLSIHPAGGLLPGRRDFDPVDVPQLLPWLWLIEFQRQPMRFKYRLIGTEHVLALGHDATGEWLDDVHPHFSKSTGYRQFVDAVTRAEIGFQRGSSVYYKNNTLATLERLLLPLAKTGRDVDMLLGMTVFIPSKSPQPI